MEPTPLTDMPSSHSSAPKVGKSKKLLFAAIIVVILALLGFGAMKLMGSQTSSETNQTASLSPSPTEFQFPTDTPVPTTEEEEPSPTTKPTGASTTASPTKAVQGASIDKTSGLDRSKVTIEIQNGSGTAGVAGKGSTFLKDLGYNVVSTGNADNYDYTGVTIKAKTSASKYVTLLKSDLSASYTVNGTGDASASQSADITVIIGK